MFDLLPNDSSIVEIIETSTDSSNNCYFDNFDTFAVQNFGCFDFGFVLVEIRRIQAKDLHQNWTNFLKDHV